VTIIRMYIWDNWPSSDIRLSVWSVREAFTNESACERQQFSASDENSVVIFARVTRETNNDIFLSQAGRNLSTPYISDERTIDQQTLSLYRVIERKLKFKCTTPSVIKEPHSAIYYYFY
jgi:hypothetical protein